MTHMWRDCKVEIILHRKIQVKHYMEYSMKHQQRMPNINKSCENESWISSHLTHPPLNWPKFRRRYFHMHFREWKFLYFDPNFTEVCSQVSNWWWHSIGLAPNRREAIIWANAVPIHCCIYAALLTTRRWVNLCICCLCRNLSSYHAHHRFTICIF